MESRDEAVEQLPKRKATGGVRDGRLFGEQSCGHYCKVEDNEMSELVCQGTMFDLLV